MKKTISIVALVALVAVLAFSLMACVAKTPEDAIAKLKENGYAVESYKEGDTGWDLAKAAYEMGTNQEVDGLNAIVMGNKKEGTMPLNVLDSDYLEKMLRYEYSSQDILILYFNDTASAKAYYEENIEKDIDKYEADKDKEKAELKGYLADEKISQEAYEEFEAAIDNSIQVGRQGKLVFVGSKEGVKAVK